MNRKNLERQSAEMKANNGAPDLPSAPLDGDLQKHYNDAYMREKQRFNSIFGIIEGDMPVPTETIFLEPSAKDYVTMKKYRRVKKGRAFFAVLTLLFGVAAVVFAYLLLK